MKLFLNITTFRDEDCSATHYYGQMREYGMEGGEIIFRVCYPLTAKQAAYINEKDGSTGKSYAYDEGDPSERFDDTASLKKAAVHMAQEKYGDDVEVYVGSPAQALEDFERLI